MKTWVGPISSNGKNDWHGLCKRKNEDDEWKNDNDNSNRNGIWNKKELHPTLSFMIYCLVWSNIVSWPQNHIRSHVRRITMSYLPNDSGVRHDVHQPKRGVERNVWTWAHEHLYYASRALPDRWTIEWRCQLNSSKFRQWVLYCIVQNERGKWIPGSVQMMALLYLCGQRPDNIGTSWTESREWESGAIRVKLDWDSVLFSFICWDKRGKEGTERTNAVQQRLTD